MQTYVLLLRYTQKGLENIKDSPNRLDSTRKLVSAAGGSLKEFYLTFGQYDAVTVIEAPDDETAARLSLAAGALGFVRGETLRAFPETQYRDLIKSLK